MSWRPAEQAGSHGASGTGQRGLRFPTNFLIGSRRGTEFAFVSDEVRHVAMHAVFRGRDGEQSAVAMAVGNDSVCMSAISCGGPPGTHHD